MARAIAPSADCWLVYSLSQGGSFYGGHGFDVGAGAAPLSSGLSSSTGTYSFSGGPVPPVLAGRTLYVELAARKSGVWHEGAGTGGEMEFEHDGFFDGGWRATTIIDSIHSGIVKSGRS